MVTAWDEEQRREDVSAPPVSDLGNWAPMMTFRERTLEEEQADCAKDGQGLALLRLICLLWKAKYTEPHTDTPHCPPGSSS